MENAKDKVISEHVQAVQDWHAAMLRAQAARRAVVEADAEVSRAANRLDVARKAAESALAKTV